MPSSESKRSISKTTSTVSSSSKSVEEVPGKNTEYDAEIAELIGPEERRLLGLWYLRYKWPEGIPEYANVTPNPFQQALLDKLDAGLCKTDIKLDAPYFEYVAVRAKQLDQWAHNFLVRHQYEDSLVLQLACGLDNRHFRLCGAGDVGGGAAGAGAEVKWIDVERPRILALRERLLPPARLAGGSSDYSAVAARLEDADDDFAWLRGVPQDRPVLIIMENILCYLAPEVGARLVQRVLAHFARGALLCDTMGSVAVTFSALVPPLNKGNRAKHPLRWGIDDAKELLQLDRRLVLRDQVFLHEELTSGWFAKGYPPLFGGWTPLLSLLPKVSSPPCVCCSPEQARRSLFTCSTD